MARSRRNSAAGLGTPPQGQGQTQQRSSSSSSTSPPTHQSPRQKKRRRRCMRLVLTILFTSVLALVAVLYPPFNLWHSPLTIKYPYSSLPIWGLQEIYHDPIAHSATFSDHKDHVVDWSTPPPGFLFRIAEWIVNYVEVLLPARVVPAPLHLMALLQGPGQLQVLRTITLLGIPELLKDRVLSLRDLHALLLSPQHQATQEKTLREGIYLKNSNDTLPKFNDLPLAKLERLMSFALSIGYFEEVSYRGSHIYVHNHQSVILRSDHPNNLNHLLFHFSNEAYLVWHNLPHAILTPEDSDTLSYIDEDGSLHDSSVIDSAVSLEMDQMAGTDTETIWRTGKGVFQGPKPVETFGVKNPKHEERKEKRMNHLRAVVDQASKQPGAPTAMTAWEKTLGQSLWPFFSSHPALGANFALGMAEVDHLVNHALVADYAWDEHGAGSKVDKLVDVGGALGSFLYEVLTAYPSIPRATLFDMDDSISQAKALWSEEQRGEYAQVRKHTKVELVAGDFFQVSSIPAPSAQGATRYVLRQILHDWSDRKAMRILKNLREAVGERKDVSLVLIEVNRSGHSSSHVRHWIDFQMLVCCNAQERTPAAWRTLLAATGWRITHTQPTRSMFQIIEVQPEPTVITPTSGQKQQSQQQLKQEL